MPYISRSHLNKVLKYSWLDTKIAPMIAISDDDGLYFLEFVNLHGFMSPPNSRFFANCYKERNMRFAFVL